MKLAGRATHQPSVEDQIVGFNRRLAFALTFVESVVRQGNRRAAIEVLDEQRSAIARTSASVTKTLVAPLHRRRRIRVVGATTLAGLLIGVSAFGALAATRRTHAPATRSSVVAGLDAAFVETGSASEFNPGGTRATRGISAPADSPQDAAALARATRDLIDETLSIAVQLSGLRTAVDLTKVALDTATEAAGVPKAPVP